LSRRATCLDFNPVKFHGSWLNEVGGRRFDAW
jgi:hypothetical protein